MRVQGFGVGVLGAFAILAVVIAVATVWLFVTNPVTVATAVNEGQVSPFVRDLARLLFQALEGLFRYL
jgi:hypothetical protein